MQPVGSVHTPGWFVTPSHPQRGKTYLLLLTRGVKSAYALFVGGQPTGDYHRRRCDGAAEPDFPLSVENKSILQTSCFVLLNTHFLFIFSCQRIVKKLLHCRTLKRLSYHPFLNSEAAMGETRYVLLWALSLSSCYSWLSARWAGVSGLSVCILGGCGDCRLCCFFLHFFIWGDKAPAEPEYEWWLLVWMHIQNLLQSVQQSFCSHYVSIKPHIIFTHTQIYLF